MKDTTETLSDLRHSCAHLLAAAVVELWPKTLRTIGPAIDTGFYYDFQFAEPITEEDLPKIEAKMHEIAKNWHTFDQIDVTAADAKRDYHDNPYKLELIEEIDKKGEAITYYKSGDFADLCRGGHIAKPNEQLKHFKLLSIAGAYWRGNENNTMLTRIYGTCFPTQQALDNHLAMLEEAKKRDHRKLGQELDLFTFSPLIGSGLPLFTPKGTVLRQELLGFSESLQKQHGFQPVFIPHIAKIDLYKTSGHWDKFGDELFLVTSQETSDQFVMKPMNCPHHAQIYAARKRSYRELPIRYMETTTVYRDEKAGELLGLSRVRAVTQDDAHIFCTIDQIAQEYEAIMGMIKTLYGTLGMEFKARLSFRDNSDKYLGEPEKWDIAQKIIEDVAKQLQLDYFIAEGEAAFYGPKIDVMIYDSLGREWQCATEQLDFVQPARFSLTYIDNEGREQAPVMIHKALLGSIERFLSVYIEHTAGAFPPWLAPVQAIVIPIADRNTSYAQHITASLIAAGIRTELDERSETMQNKVRTAQLQKIPYMIILGDREVELAQVSVRTRDNAKKNDCNIAEVIEQISQAINTKSLTVTI